MSPDVSLTDTPERVRIEVSRSNWGAEHIAFSSCRIAFLKHTDRVILDGEESSRREQTWEGM